MKGWLLGVAMALNQLANALLGGNPDMTVSARAGYARAKGAKLGAGVCHVLNTIDPRDAQAPEGDHCVIAMRHFEEGRNE